MSEYILKTENLSKVYKQNHAVNNVSMTINKGDIYGLVGRNGAGKTTLIRMITGLINKTSGEYSLDLKPGKGRIGGIVESPSIFLNMNAYDNMKAQMLTLGFKDYSKIQEILEIVGLDKTGKKKAADFSLGMRQRLGIAMCLVGEPEFLLLDEPTNGLDPQGIAEMREFLHDLNRRGITILISSHILSELGKIATRYGFIEKGHLIKEITQEELMNSNKNCMEYVLSSVTGVSDVLKDLGVTNFEIINSEKVRIYDNIEVGKVVMALSGIGVFVKGTHEKKEDLEAYFLDLIGGGANV